jgi:hypothetical protein
MTAPLSGRNEQLLEEFLEDLLPGIDRKEDFDLIVEILANMQKTGALPARDDAPANVSRLGGARRFEILKMQPEGIASLGYVDGFDDARQVLSGLNAAESGVCFLYDNLTNRVVEFLNDSSEREIQNIRESVRGFRTGDRNPLPS